MLDRIFYPLMFVLSLLVVLAALVWPVGIGAENPPEIQRVLHMIGLDS